MPSRTRKERVGKPTRKQTSNQTNTERQPQSDALALRSTGAAALRGMQASAGPVPVHLPGQCRTGAATHLDRRVPDNLLLHSGACVGSSGYSHGVLRVLVWVLRVLAHGTSSSSGKAGAPLSTERVRVLTQGTPSTQAGYCGRTPEKLLVLVFHTLVPSGRNY